MMVLMISLENRKGADVEEPGVLEWSLRAAWRMDLSYFLVPLDRAFQMGARSLIEVEWEHLRCVSMLILQRFSTEDQVQILTGVSF